MKLIFEQQLAECRSQGRRNQKQGFLMRLHISMVEGWVEPLEIVDPKDKASFFGWKGFTVIPRHSENFKKRILQLFLDEKAGGNAKVPKQTVHNMFRNTKLIPKRGGWDLAFKGETSFKFKKRTNPSRENESNTDDQDDK
ncbi:hypothetical protein GUITHDRAFT_108487 [Guillardia theta CCMP2712]|uniref:Uncharacterized protein n=1 Tax=Guillardia theta (strain CCMP2712) TaxID=905079 RepID=L1JBB1_GUITC|nr:hypothetical protein GUITHDRAFT_108487 [Guillardia theta CCMP2712]EKX45612.1 hypothetical protein GUITHDRAFT_108487 [Guillardia theta CCMP2712]|eukprot:XP_005832592.1 hypothetical protein GUITHDRAFT_108487 [Guillardia theta CCMP2712]